MSAAAPARRPARFAGSWYPGEPDRLRATIAAALPAAESASARVVVAPHAGYRYSLRIAAEAYARVRIPRRVLLLCPNHTVPPPIVSLWPGGAWETPLGEIPSDDPLIAGLLAECPTAVAETGAHRREHAIELHLPILQHLQPELRIAAMVVAAPSYAVLAELGQGIAHAVRALDDDVLIVASTDMTHFESAEVARRQDERALARVEALDAPGLLELCTREGITMCGVRPTTAALVAARELGATRAERVCYGHSGEVSGDDARVVGYAALVVR